MTLERSITKIDTGPFKLTVGATDIGYTKGDLKFSYKPQYRPRVIDSLGTTVLDFIHTGEELKITVTVKQEQVELLTIMAPEGMAGGTTFWYLGRNPGGKASTHSATLTLEPLNTAATTITKIYFWKAIIIDGFERNFSWDEDSDYNVTFTILPDTTKTDGKTLGYVQYTA